MGLRTLSTEYKCDRCGVVHVENERESDPIGFGMQTLPEQWGQIHGVIVGDVCGAFLLCPPCAQGFRKWLRWGPTGQPREAN
jgi:hypothetical protein